jgi:hypothetical protein
MSTCEEFIESYHSWLQSKLTCGQVNGVFQMTTPFRDNHNDHIQIYVIPGQDNLMLTDDGNTLNDLAMSGIEISTKKRQEIFDTIIRSYGVILDSDDSLTIHADNGNFPQKIHDLIQAILSVCDLQYLSRPHIQSLFHEDVERLLQENEIPMVPDVRFVRKSGLYQSFDFAIPGTRTRPEQIIKLISNIRKDRIGAFIFEWNDVQEIRKTQSIYVPIIDDISNSVKEESLSAFTAYGIHPRLFSELQKNPEKLTT